MGDDHNKDHPRRAAKPPHQTKPIQTPKPSPPTPPPSSPRRKRPAGAPRRGGGHVGVVRAGVRAVRGVRAVGVEAAHLHRRLRQRDLAARRSRRLRARPAHLPHHHRHLRSGPLQPQARAARPRVRRHRPRRLRQAHHLRRRRQHLPALRRLCRQAPQGGRPRRPRPQPRPQRRLQGPVLQSSPIPQSNSREFPQDCQGDDESINSCRS